MEQNKCKSSACCLLGSFSTNTSMDFGVLLLRLGVGAILEENEVRYEEIGCDDADYVIVAFGSSARICSATVEMARAEGLKVGLLRPITLYPFPKKPLAELAARGVKGT